VVGIFSWLFNPYIFLVVEATGVVDIIGTFFAVLSLFLLIKEKVSLSGIALAISIIARFYPLIFLPFYMILLIKEKKASKIVKFLLPFITILIFALSPLILNYGYDKAIKLLLSMLTEYKEFLWFFGVPITSFTAPSQSISLIIIAYTLLLFQFYKKKENSRFIESLNESLLITLLTFFALGIWNSYYTLWFIPFLTIDCIINNVKRMYPLSLLFFLFLFNSMLLYFGFPDILFFMPVKNTPLYIISKALYLIKETLIPGELFTTFLRSIFAGLCAIYSISILLRKSAKSFHLNVK
jgi:uncharacterized membrane protein